MTNIKKCEICGKTAHHIHHKDFNHKNNDPENLQPLCTLCHAKIHGIDLRISELRKHIDYFKRAQKARISFEHYLRAYEWMELIPPKAIINMLSQIEKLEKQSEKNIKNYFKENGHKNPMYNWLISIKGISNILAGQLIAYIDIDKTPSIANLWSYAGLKPDDNKRKGNKCNWNHNLKSVCYLVSDSFIKQRTPKYREIYDKEKEKQLNKEYPEGYLKENYNKSNNTNGYKKSDIKIKLGHADNRARRKIVKVFLKDLYLQWKKDHSANETHPSIVTST